MRTRALMSCAAVSLALLGCGGGSPAGSDTSASTTTHARAPLPRDRDLVAACQAIEARARQLMRAAGAATPGPVEAQRVRSVDFSSCRFASKRTPGFNVHVTLDTAPHVLQGYRNRLVESEQFGQENTKGLAPQRVRGVGDRHVGGTGANWLPVLNQLLSVRGHHMLAVTFFVHGLPVSERERMARETSLLTWHRLGVRRH
jgi:hypothetical protein